MTGRIGTFLLGVVVGAVLIYGGQRYHVVRADDGTYLVPKTSATFAEMYVDIREFSVADWTKHKSLAAALVMAKKDHLLNDSGAHSFKEGIRSAIEHLADDVKGTAQR